MSDIISNIIEIPRDKKRVTVLFDNGETVTLFKTTVKEYALREGQSISRAEVLKIAVEGEEHIAFTTAIDSLSRGLKSQNEIKKMLKTKGFSSDAVNSAVTKLLSYNYLGDVQYAEAYVSYKGEKMGRRKIIYDMITVKGIDKSIAENVAYDKLTDEFELDKALRLAQKYVDKEKKKRSKIKDKTYGFLAMRGFDSEIISAAMSKLDFSNDFDE